MIHTRVSEALDEELRQRAADLGVSVSNLVRNVLANTVEMVEEMTRDAVQVADATRQSVERVKQAWPGTRASAPWASVANVASAAPERLGWQELILDKNALCEQCNAVLPRGTGAAAAVYAGPGPAAFLCKPCVQKLGGGNRETKTE